MLLKNSLPLQNLLSLDLSSESLMPGVLSKNLLRSFFLPMSTSCIQEPITGVCASKYFTSLNKSSIGFWFFIMFFEMRSSLRLKLASFSLLFVTYKLISPCISLPNLLVVKIYFFTSPLGVFFHRLLLKINVLQKVFTIKSILAKRLNKAAGKIVQSFCLLFLMYFVVR